MTRTPQRRFFGDLPLTTALVSAMALFLLVFLALPILTVFSKSLQGGHGEFVGFANFARYFSSPRLVVSIGNTIQVATLTMLICVPLAFGFAYCLTHTCMRGRAVFRAIAFIPILAPSLLPAMAFVYLFGNQGLLKDWLFGGDIYGPRGIVLAQTFYCFPHALIILTTAMSMIDSRLYEASTSLGASAWRTFLRVTLPASRYGLISACFVVFTLVTTDFGVPKIIGGNFNVLSTDIYKQVIGQHNFEMGAVVGVVLLTPTVIAFMVDRFLQKRHAAVFSSRSVVFMPQPSFLDSLAFVFCAAISIGILTVILMSGWASFIKFWPYDLSLTLNNYAFTQFDSLGWEPYFNSIKLAALVAIFGAAVVFSGAYLVEKTSSPGLLRAAIQFMAIMPVAVPGMVLGLGYIFVFNNPVNPLSFIYGGFAILAINTIIHFYTVPHITCISALKQIDKEFELISDSLRASRFMTFRRITLPLCSVAVLDVAAYFFVNAMTTVASVIFLYSAATKPAAVSAISMDDSGMPAAAMAMGMMIVYTSIGVKLAQVCAERVIVRRTHRWRRRDASVDASAQPAPA
jgi:iron(III) transport system permease protein